MHWMRTGTWTRSRAATRSFGRFLRLPEPVAVKQAEYATEVAQQLGAAVTKPDVAANPEGKGQEVGAIQAQDREEMESEG